MTPAHRPRTLPLSLSATIAALATFGALHAGAQGPAGTDPRGQLLYSTHCIACHTTEMHWRDKKLATDWVSLKDQVRRWQSNGGLSWSDSEIADVARYLNAQFYHYPVTGNEPAQAALPLPLAATSASPPR